MKDMSLLPPRSTPADLEAATDRFHRLSALAPPDPRIVWETWSALIVGLVESGVTKSLLSALSGLPCSAGKLRTLARLVLYPRTDDWIKARDPDRPSRHHCSQTTPPWQSIRVAHDLIEALESMSSAEVDEQHPAVARRARDALSHIEKSRRSAALNIFPAQPLATETDRAA